jgi:hypothetical protein
VKVFCKGKVGTHSEEYDYISNTMK